ncbi:Gcn1p [Ascoidea rubescens DSM 1968]|uniref:ARM repeat-containing protein n=1 Tax=Ascoidea rubescens DSM 1968 TaxID=1344418 RepID=A0A1D2VAW9_9ASCO|nr:ARM repeat-containing protein [Ascoidea rubescens DSM 1968]ODV58740.1 ARM repeat-containing protein [Ascoidea rubescens DSM 1968]
MAESSALLSLSSADLTNHLLNGSTALQLQTLQDLDNLLVSNSKDVNHRRQFLLILKILLVNYNKFSFNAHSRTFYVNNLIPSFLNLSFNNDSTAKDEKMDFNSIIIKYFTDLISSNLITSSLPICDVLFLLEIINKTLILNSIHLVDTGNSSLLFENLIISHSILINYTTYYSTSSLASNYQFDPKLPPPISPNANHKLRIQNSIFSNSINTLSIVFKNLQNPQLSFQGLQFIQIYLDSILQSKLSKINLPNSSILLSISILSKSIQNLIPAIPNLFHFFNTKLDLIIDFYNNNILLNKFALLPLVYQKFDLYFINLFTNDPKSLFFKSKILPVLIKASLRSPELIFGHISSNLFLNLKINLSYNDLSKLYDQLFTNLKNSKDFIRNGSKNSLINSLSIINDNTSISKIIDRLFVSLRSASNLDHKFIFTSILNNLKFDQNSFDLQLTSSIKIINNLSALISKDQIENSLYYNLSSFFNHFFILLTLNHKFDDSIIKILLKGFNDNKLNLRKNWYLNFGHNFLSNYNHLKSSPEFLNILSQLLPTFLTNFDSIINNPLSNLVNKNILSSYVVLSICFIISNEFKSQSLQNSFDINSIFQNAYKNDEKPSILVNSKIYSKFNNHDEVKWLSHALFYSINYFSNLSDLTLDNNTEDLNSKSVCYSLSWLYLLLSKNISFEIRKPCYDLVTKLFKNHQLLVGDLLIDGLFESLRNSNTYFDSEKFNFDFKLIPNIFIIISSSNPSEKSIIIKHLKNLLVICNHLSVKIKNGWVGACQKANLDPGKIVADDSEKMFLQCYDLLLISGLEKSLYRAAVESINLLAFVSPDTIGPIVESNIKKDVSINKLKLLNDINLKIWKSDSSTVVINPITDAKSKNQKSPKTAAYSSNNLLNNKNLSANSKKKTSWEDQQLINEQLKKESSIRLTIQENYLHLKRGVSIIDGLGNSAKNVNNGYEYYFSTAVNSLLAIMENNYCSIFLNSEASDAFLALSNIISPRLGATKLFVGVATLRIYEVGNLPSNLLEEPVLELLSRILFRIKFLSDQVPLDIFSLIYILPLLTKVLQNGKLVAMKNANKHVVARKAEFAEEDKEEDLLMLAVEIVANHSEVLDNENIVKKYILEVLLSLMMIPSKAKIAKECFNSLCQSVSDSLSEEDVSIILSSLLTPEVFARNAVLDCLDSEFDLSLDMSYSNEIWISTFDNNDHNAEIALTIWRENGFVLDKTAPLQLMEFLANKDSGIRLSVSKSIFAAIDILSKDEPAIFLTTLEALLDLYKLKSKPPEPILDEYGLVIKSSTDQKDPWEIRSGIALTLKYCSPLFSNKISVLSLFNFFINEGALGDSESIVRQEFQDAGIDIINLFGSQNLEGLIPIFERFLASKTEKNSKTQNNIKEITIILYGALAKHLKSSDKRLIQVVDRLIKTLDTPSVNVQRAISNCLAGLVPLIPKSLPDYIDLMFKKLFEAKYLYQRRGAGFGLAGFVKGAGIKALFEYDIVRTLIESAEDKKDPIKREGVSIAVSCLSESLDKFFEPYALEILPVILKNLGDISADVRLYTDITAKTIMKSTTGFGVKKIIPLAIDNLDDISWRSKKASVELLGSMAYLDPTQLSFSLSTIVPEIVSVLTDTHKEVRKSADQSLKRFGEVIRNPEIQKLVPILIKAIGNPTKYTDESLDELIKTQFVHYIDGPSLALIIHVIHRGMVDRSASTKRKACQIVGNMAILVDNTDLYPYLPSLVNELEVAMVDPVGTTRATAARALGSLVEKLGEDNFPGLVDKLFSTFEDPDKRGDRLGAAQALAEVISGLGVSKLDECLPIILSGTTSSISFIREGFMPLLLFLPACFGNQFAPYISKIIPSILNGLADVDPNISETAMRSGKLLVKNYANKAIDLLLPELENGLCNSSYRIRLSSIQLIGELLYQVTGLNRNAETSEEVEFSGVGKRLVEVLGIGRRNVLLSSLFFCRFDVDGVVRNAALDIWKSLVYNTPRTLKEILPTIISLTICRLADDSGDLRETAARSLADLTRRVGSLILQELLPIYEKSSSRDDSDVKQGICIALRELIQTSDLEVVSQYQESFITIIRDCLIDNDDDVRSSAGLAFEVLQDTIGKAAIDGIIPHLLHLLASSDHSDNALYALQEIMATKSDDIFPILIPTLLSPPVDAFKASALGSLAEVAGNALYRRLSSIINVLVEAIIQNQNNKKEQEEIDKAFQKILLSIEDERGLHPLLQQLLSFINSENPQKKAVVYKHLCTFFEETNLDYSVYTQDIVTNTISSLDDENEDVVYHAWHALSMLISLQSKESLERLVKPAQESLVLTGVNGVDLPGFKLPKGPSCILPVFIRGLMYGTSEQRQLSADGIAEIVSKTPPIILKTYVTAITGPLIRVIGDRFNGDVKASILSTLNILFSKVPQFLRPFIPQLQRTFVKSLLDSSNETLRSKAAKALGSLIEHQPRVDPLVTELVNSAKATNDPRIKFAIVNAIVEVVNKSGSKMGDASKSNILRLIEEDSSNSNENLITMYAKLIGSLSKILNSDSAAKILRTKILLAPFEDETANFSILTMNSFLQNAPVHIFADDALNRDIGDIINAGINSKIPHISENSIIAAGKYLLLHGNVGPPKRFLLDNSQTNHEPFFVFDETIEELINSLCIAANKPKSNSLEARRLSLVVLRTLSRFEYNEIIKENITKISLAIFMCVRDSIIPIKLAAEKAYIECFNLVHDEDSKFFQEWFEKLRSENQDSVSTIIGSKILLRSIGDYTKRVATRLAKAEREKIAAGGDEEVMFSDKFEDENEIWAV